MIGATRSILTFGQVAGHFGVYLWQLQYLARIGRFPSASRVGNTRTLTEDNLPAIERAIRDGGYLKSTAEAV